MSKNFTLPLDKIVIGSSIEALLYAYYNKCKVIFTNIKKPQEFDHFINFGMGIEQINIWNKLIFLLSISGSMPFQDKIKHISYIDKNSLKVVTKEESVIKLNFNKLFVFDDENLLDIGISTKTTSNKIRIVDWFKLEDGCIDKFEKISNNTKFMKEIIFFNFNKRINSKKKNLCVISYCNKDEIENIPEHVTKIKTEALLTKIDLEKYKNNKSTIKLDHEHRDILEYGKNVYEDFDNVEFNYNDAKFIYETNQFYRKINYTKYLEMKLKI